MTSDPSTLRGRETPMTCAAYVGRRQPLARGGRRYRPCSRPATTTRTVVETSIAWRVDREIHLCGQHATQFDKAERGEGFRPRLRSDDR